MFEEQVNRILQKAKKAKVSLGTKLEEEEISKIEMDLGIELPATYRTYLTKIQNRGLGKIEDRKPMTKDALFLDGLPEAIQQEMLEAFELRQKIVQKNLANNAISQKHIFFNKIEPDAVGPYYGLFSLNTSLSNNMEIGVDIREAFPFEKDFDLGEVANEGNVISWEEHQEKLNREISYRLIWDNLEEKYAHDPQYLSGTIPICDYGCGDQFVLVINGQNKGEVWVNSLPGITGIYSLKVDILTFFENWLDKEIAIQEGKSKDLINAYYSYLEFGNNKRYKIVD